MFLGFAFPGTVVHGLSVATVSSLLGVHEHSQFSVQKSRILSPPDYSLEKSIVAPCRMENQIYNTLLST